MKMKAIKNPIWQELKDCKLISDTNLIKINNNTRDKKIKVLQDKKSKVIFLEKYFTNTDYYSTLKNYNDLRKVSEKSKRKIANVKTSLGNIKTPIIEDDLRRAKQFSKLLKNKDVLDFGCGWGGFLKIIKNAKSISGIELSNQEMNYIKKKLKRIEISNNINSFSKKFDVITLFHVLEHIPYQIKTLKLLKSKLKKKGKIIIEVPHAEDFLILQDNLKEFKNFTFWSEHLVLHTYKSLKTILHKSGFKKVSISFYQRHDFSNHLGWFLEREPNRNKKFKQIINDRLNKCYIENLVRLGQTDTLIAIAQ